MSWILLIHLIMLSPVLLEMAFDKIVWVWKGMGKDKPFSTYILRPILFTGAIVAVTVMDGREWWRAAGVVLAYFILFFPIGINLILHQKWYHLSPDQFYDKLVAKIPGGPIVRLWIFIWLSIFAVCNYYYYELIYHIPLLFK